MFKRLNEVYEKPADELSLEELEKLFDLENVDDLLNIDADLVVPTLETPDNLIDVDAEVEGADGAADGNSILIPDEDGRVLKEISADMAKPVEKK